MTYLQQWDSDHPDLPLVEFSKLSLSDQSGGKSIRVPKYLKQRYKDSDYAQLYRDVCERGILAAQSREALELSKTDLEYIDYLAVKEHNQVSALDLLCRDKI